MKGIMKGIIIGCDPAFRKNGFALAIIDLDRTIRFIKFKEPLDFIGWLFHESPNRAYAYIENSNKQKLVFSKYYQHLIRKPMAITRKLSMAASIGASVGKNQAISEIAFRLLKETFPLTVGVSPKEKGSKKSAEYLLLLCKKYNLKLDSKELKGNANEDKRDALHLALRYFTN